jgi:hypothetical protein
LEETMDVISTPTEDEGRDQHDSEELSVRAWRTEQLGLLGLPPIVAETFADLVDWHALAGLVERGCPPALALDIVR